MELQIKSVKKYHLELTEVEYNTLLTSLGGISPSDRSETAARMNLETLDAKQGLVFYRNLLEATTCKISEK